MIFRQLCILILILFIYVTPSWSYSFSGEWMFNVSGNDPSDATSAKSVEFTNEIEDLIESWFLTEKKLIRDIELEYYDRVNATDDASVAMSLTYDSSNLFGTWSTLQSIEFYTVKGGNEFAMYWIDGGASSGTWTTEHLTNGGGEVPTISHLTSYNPSAAPVPEPATMILFGTGLAGLVGSRFKKRMK